MHYKCTFFIGSLLDILDILCNGLQMSFASFVSFGHLIEALVVYKKNWGHGPAASSGLDLRR